MSGIRFKPNYVIQPTSPEVKKLILCSSLRKKQICIFPKTIPTPVPIIIKLIFDGGTPSLAGLIKDGGTPSAGGSQIYYGGIP
jgi:hypothetical protein